VATRLDALTVGVKYTSTVGAFYISREKNRSNEMAKLKDKIVFEKKILKTAGGLEIRQSTIQADISYREQLLDALNHREGAYFCSSFEFPGRYNRWDIGFSDPALVIETKGKSFFIYAKTGFGENVLYHLSKYLRANSEIKLTRDTEDEVFGDVSENTKLFFEADRSKKNSIFTFLRSVLKFFKADSNNFFGLYGGFGYDLLFQFEDIEMCLDRDFVDRDMKLYLPEKVFIIDHMRNETYFEQFEIPGIKTKGPKSVTHEVNALAMNTSALDKTDEIKEETNKIVVIDEATSKMVGKSRTETAVDYQELVNRAIPHFVNGDFFEVVPSHVIKKEVTAKPSDIFKKLLSINPSPYGFFINFGNEHLVGASPEMYVRIEGNRVETCPISGTIERGKDSLEEHENIKKLLNSDKDESELTMCTDVDRNDKSRICVPGSVKVIGRRQLELYSHLIHTVDHVEGTIAEEFDALDAFISHMWAVTVTGAPKKAAIQWIENNEGSSRRWYGGAVGVLSFNGNVNTGLTLRTMSIRNGFASIRVGATVLYGSDAALEEKETYTKAAALIKVIDSVELAKKLELSKRQENMDSNNSQDKIDREKIEAAKKIEQEKAKERDFSEIKIMICDHEDSFVHTLGSYFRQFGTKVDIVRHGFAIEQLKKEAYDLLILSPGPGRPIDFRTNLIIKEAIDMKLPIFGVCLGLQALVEYFDGELGILAEPCHGKRSEIRIEKESRLFDGISEINVKVGRYHSIFGKKISEELSVTASTEERIAMAIEHKTLPISAVQFHPESIMTKGGALGERIIENVLRGVRYEKIRR